MKRPILALCVCAALVGCGGGDGDGGGDAETVDCAWFEGPDNCMKAVLQEVEACRPDVMSSGTWNMDNTACTYDSGAVVEFPASVPEDTFGEDSTYLYAFTLKDAAGATCAEVQETESGITVTTASGTYSDGGDISFATVSCPDGANYKIPTGDAFGCLFALNGYSSSGQGGGGALSFGLLGGGESAQLFSCSAP